MGVMISYQEPVISVPLTPRQLLALAGALRIVDDELLLDEGFRTGGGADLEALQEVFEIADDITSDLFGDDWPVLVTTPERLEQDQHPDAEWDDGDEPVGG